MSPKTTTKSTSATSERTTTTHPFLSELGIAAEPTGDVEDRDRNVITQPGETYKVITDGNAYYLIRL